MEYFQKAKAVRLRSHHDKYLLADDDQEGIFQDRNGCCKNAKWSVEIVENANVIRLKSCYGKYLTASNIPFLLGATGKKVLQTLLSRLDSSLEWEPIREGVQIRLKTRYGQYLRANKGLPPWKNSITHDIPQRTVTANWVLWDVDLVELRPQDPKPSQQSTPIITQDRSLSSTPLECAPSLSDIGSKVRINLRASKQNKRNVRDENGSPEQDGRIIFYNVGEENANKESSFTFKGSNVEELKEKLKEETGLDDIQVCCRNPLNAELYPLRLQLPPNNTDLHVVVIPASLN